MHSDVMHSEGNKGLFKHRREAVLHLVDIALVRKYLQ